VNIRNKISAIILLATLLVVVATSFGFDRFFISYLETQEDQQIYLIETNLGTFIADKIDKYQGSANDYGHWDDPYDYLNGSYPTFIEDDLQADVFSNLELSFVAISGADGVIRDKLYFSSANQNFTEFPAEIDIGEVLKFAILRAS
jgi:sensor domain CHASE-containing protein